MNSYHDQSGTTGLPHMNSSAGFKEMFKLRDQPGYRFADLLDAVANSAPEVRFRFTSPHPKDFPLPVLQAINSHRNVCKQIHIPAQSGNTRVLQSMRRNYSRETYLELIAEIRSTIPGVALSSDFIAGFCGETEEEFHDTLTLIEQVKYDFGFMFAYSMREKTHAHRSMKDDVPEEVKKDRLQRMIDTFLKAQLEITQQEIGKYHLVLIDGPGKKPGQLKGRTDTYRPVIFEVPQYLPYLESKSSFKDLANEAQGSTLSKGDYVIVKIDNCTSNTLFGKPVCKTGFNTFFELSNDRPFFRD